MNIKTRLYLNTTICIVGIIGISVFSLITIQMIRDKITVLTSQSTPLQVKTVKMQQTVEKLSADLLQIGLVNDPTEIKEISATINRESEALEKLHADISNIKKLPMETAVFSELHAQIVRATNEKFSSMAVFKEEAAKVNGALSRIDKSLASFKEIIANLVLSASRRAITATQTLNNRLEDKKSNPEILESIQDYRNEVDNDLIMHKRISIINDIVYVIGVDAKLLDAKARLIMLSTTPKELELALSEAQTVQTRITRNLTQAGAKIKEIKNSGFVDDAVATINAAVASAGMSLRTIANSQRKVLDNMAFVDASVKKVKEVAVEQGKKSEQQVKTTAEEQQQFVELVGTRVEYFKKLLIGLSLIIVSIALIISVTTMICINRSLKRMTDAFSAIVETGDFRISALIKNDDEFGVTIRAFNKLVESFTGIITAVSTSSARLSQSSQGLTSTTQEIYDAIGNQSVNIGQVAAASMEMTKSVSLISNNSARIDKAANDARAIAESGAEVVAMTCAEVQEIAQVVMESTQVMNELSERSQQVGDIVDVIVDITDQTNLLALNAAIEAARAGDHGRGFAVVADEVRKLANRAAEAAVGITERIKSIQNDTEKAVSTMSTSMERVSRGVGYSRQAGDSLRNIVDSVIHLKEMTAEISSATVELADTSKDISTDIIAVEKSSSETIKAAAHIAGESDKLAMLAVELKDEISRYTYHEAQSMFSARRLDDKNEKTGHNLGMKPATGTPLHSLTFSPAA